MYYYRKSSKEYYYVENSVSRPHVCKRKGKEWKPSNRYYRRGDLDRDRFCIKINDISNEGIPPFFIKMTKKVLIGKF